MVTKKILAIIFLVISTNLYPQTDDESRIIHRFSWSGGEYALYYEVVFEQIADDTYMLYLHEITESHFIEVSLPIGNYRFRVIPYDVLERPSTPSDWRYIEIIPVPVPIVQVEPEPEPQPEVEHEPESQHEPLPQLEPELRRERTSVIKLGVAWSPALPLYGESFGTGFSIIGATARVSLVSRAPLNIHIGPELTVNYDMGDHTVITVGANLLALKILPNEKFALGFKIGGAYPIASDGEQGLITNIGASFHWYLTKNFMLEAGFDFPHIFTLFPSGSLRPWIGFGFKI